MMVHKPTASYRRTGRTTRAIGQAEPNSIYVWPTADFTAPKAIAAKLGREDVRIVNPAYLNSNSFKGLESYIIFDHSVPMGFIEAGVLDAVHGHNVRILARRRIKDPEA